MSKELTEITRLFGVAIAAYSDEGTKNALRTLESQIYRAIDVLRSEPWILENGKLPTWGNGK